MKKIILIISTLCLILSACSGSGRKSADDYSLAAYTPRHARFSIDSAAGAASTVLTVRNPWQGNDSAVSRLFIARNGEEAPAGFEGAVIRNQAMRIVAMSSTFVAMLDAVGAADRIVGVSGIDYISNPYIQAGRDTIADVGYEGALNYEALLSVAPDLVLVYGVNGPNPMESKLRELGVPYVYVGDYVEESPLGKAEWMVALGEITGRRDEAVRAFADIESRYDSLATKVRNVQERPVVMLNSPYGDSWFLPPTGSYMVSLITDAGGDYVFKENDSRASMPVDMEKAYLLTDRSDLWLNVDIPSSMEEFRKRLPKFSDAKPVRAGQVYSNKGRANAAGGNDFFESGVVRPDAVLSDLITIIHPEAASDTALVYYRRLR